jgi:hypothetical protein
MTSLSAARRGALLIEQRSAAPRSLNVPLWVAHANLTRAYVAHRLNGNLCARPHCTLDVGRPTRGEVG